MKNLFSTRHWLTSAIPFTVALMAVILRLNAGPRIIDDAYITYRYSRNILAGNGFVFNPGERVLGTTTPLYTLLLGLLSLPFGGASADFPLISYVFNAAIDGATCLFLYQLGKKLHTPLLGIASSLAFALAPFSVTFSIGGLETSLYVFLLVGICLLYIHQRFEWASLIAALAFLTRPDALILILPLFGDFTALTFSKLRKQKAPFKSWEFQQFLRVALIFLLPSTAWFLFAYFYFGSLFPNSIAAKALAYRLPEHSALIRLLQHYATPFSEDLTLGKWGIAMGLILYPSLSLFGGLHLFRITKRSLAMVIFPWLYFLAFSLANPLIFRWYLTPPIPFYFLCIFMGLITFWEQLFQGILKKSSRLAIFSILQVVFSIVTPTLLILPAWQAQPSHGPNRPAPEMAYIQLELHYAEAANFLTSHAQESLSNATIAAGDVGVLGYLTNATILDTVGLNSPKTLRYFPLDERAYVINYAIPAQLILDVLPDYLVILEVYGRNTLLTNRDFLDNYQLIHQSTPIFTGVRVCSFLSKKSNPMQS